MSPETLAAVQEAADGVVAALRRYELEEHDGGPSVTERANTLAYLLHAFGTDAADDEMWGLVCGIVRARLFYYQARHREVALPEPEEGSG